MSKKYVESDNKALVGFIRRELKANGGYCPSKFIKNDDTKCPCSEFKEIGFCECGLYIMKRKKEE